MKYAPAREDGLFPYVVTRYSTLQGGDVASIVYAPDLKTAKAGHSSTNTWHPTKVRRARVEDMATR